MGHSALLFEDSVLIYGGCNGNKVLNDTFYLNLSQISENKVRWYNLQTYGDAPRRQFHTANIIGNQMLVFGGEDGKLWLNELYSLDLRSNKWKKVATYGNTPIGRLQHTTVLVGSKLLVFGGYDG